MGSVKSAASSQCGTAFLLAGVVVLLTSCVTYPIARAPEGDPITAARALPDAPRIVQEGNAADTCGEFVLKQNEAVPAEAIDCLDTATEEAELAWSFPTTEGDPIVYFAAVASSNDEVVVSMTNEFDSHGGEFGWTQLICIDANTATTIGNAIGCQESTGR